MRVLQSTRAVGITVLLWIALAASDARAVELFEKSAQAYREGRFQEAVELLLQARKLKAEPVLLYNLGRAYEAQGKLPEAVDAYSKYLEEDPNAADRRAIEGRIATMRRDIEEKKKRDEAPPPAAPPAPIIVVPPPPAPRESPLPWLVTGAGVVTLGVGIGFGVLASRKEDEARSEPVQTTAASIHEDARGHATIANVTMTVGAAVAVAGVVWLVVRLLNKPSAPPRAAFVF
jgi:tetratricopeptide (TPR) repeat protein